MTESLHQPTNHQISNDLFASILAIEECNRHIRIDNIIEVFESKLRTLNQEKLGNNDTYTRFNSFLIGELHKRFLDKTLPEIGNWKVGSATTILLSALANYMESSKTSSYKAKQHFDLILQNRDTFFGLMILDNELLQQEIDQYNRRF